MITGSELFSLLTCLHTAMVTLLSIFYPLEMISIKSGRRHCPNRVKKLFKKSKLATITFLALGDDREIKPRADGNRQQIKMASLKNSVS